MNDFNDKESLAVLKLAKTMAEIDKAVSIEEYGVLKALIGETATTKELISNYLQMADALDMNEAIITISNFSTDQKKKVKTLLKQVLSADGIIADSETKLFELIKVICNL